MVLRPIPELSIIVPVLNEEGSLPILLESLATQAGVNFELIVVDGGSSDGTLELLRVPVAFPLRLVCSSAGRARQLNAGADAAAADTLLFLHADSRFPGVDALARAMRCRQASQRLFAGRFRLQFRREQAAYGFGYYFWECKARLDRPACIHGDQGLLVSRSLFEQFGPFDERAPLAPETRFADRVRCQVPWQLLPAGLETSARRFETEGLAARQTLNALLMNFAAIGWKAYFQQAWEIYRTQDQAAPLVLQPHLELIDQLLSDLPVRERRRIWLATGHFVRSHAWQLPFALDARRGYARGLAPDELPTPRLHCHDRWFDRVTANHGGDLLAAWLTRGWFRLLVWRAARRRI